MQEYAQPCLEPGSISSASWEGPRVGGLLEVWRKFDPISRAFFMVIGMPLAICDWRQRRFQRKAENAARRRR